MAFNSLTNAWFLPMVDSIGNGDLNAFSKAYLLASKDLKTQPIDGKGWNDG